VSVLYQSFFIAIFIALPYFGSHAKGLTVNITKATWDGKDVTELANSFCADKVICPYKISRQFIGNPLDENNLSFEIQWNCSNKTKVKTETLLSDAEEQTLSLDCSNAIEKINSTPAKKPSNSIAGSSSLDRKSSFASFFLQHFDRFRSDLGMACVDSLLSVYRNGKTLYNSAAVKMSQKISEVPFRSERYSHLIASSKRTNFFHYTNARAMLDQFHPELQDRKQAHKKSISDGTYDQAFLYLKDKMSLDRLTGGRRIFNGVFYVAEDPESSKNYGTLRVTFNLNPNAKLISIPASKTNCELSIWAELISKTPEVERNCDCAAVQYFIYDDSDIALIDYNDNSDRMWFQLLNPNSIESIELDY
jgi:hypothetical protein